MNFITFNIFDKIKELILYGMNIQEISNILNVPEKTVIGNLKEIRKSIVDCVREEEFIIVKSINSIFQRNDMGIDLKLLNDIISGKDFLDICKENSINYTKLLALMKELYVSIFIYNEEYKMHLPLIRERMNTLNDIVYDKYNACKKTKLIYHNEDKTLFGSNSQKLIESNAPVRSIYELDDTDYLRMLIISDTHIGSVDENLDYLHEVYEYASKNGIKIILHGGDLIEGNISHFKTCKDNYKSTLSQTDHVLNDYCYDKSIVNLIVLGNHDSTLLINSGVDIYDVLSGREDLIPLSYRRAYIRCGNEYILLKHEDTKKYNVMKDELTFLSVIGHTHLYNASHNGSSCSIKVPTLSDSIPNKESFNIGFIDMQLWFQNGFIKELRTDYIPTNKELKNKYYTLELKK